MISAGQEKWRRRGITTTRGGGAGTAAERDLLLRWGNRKRLRCVKVHRCDVEAATTIAAKKAAIGQRRATAAAAAAQHQPTGYHHRVHRSVRLFFFFYFLQTQYKRK
jgi:hypothetical protein